MSKKRISERLNPVVSRRRFSLALAGLAGLPRFSLRDAVALQSAVSPEQAKEIYRRSVVIDCLGALYGGNDFSDSRRQQQFGAIKESGLTAINLTVGVGEYDDTKETIAYWQKEIREHPSNLPKFDSPALRLSRQPSPMRLAMLYVG